MLRENNEMKLIKSKESYESLMFTLLSLTPRITAVKLSSSSFTSHSSPTVQ